LKVDRECYNKCEENISKSSNPHPLTPSPQDAWRAVKRSETTSELGRGGINTNVGFLPSTELGRGAGGEGWSRRYEWEKYIYVRSDTNEIRDEINP
jgi:hypothetical protein